jgi:holliday junction DNA helicase RuvB
MSPREEVKAELLTAPTVDPVEVEAETSLRPRRLDEFVGQPHLKDHLGIVLEAAKGRSEPVGHLLLCGPPGLGKTTLSHVITHEMECALRPTSGPALERAGDLASILTNLEDGDVLFIDEIHRLPRTVEEVLYPAMEDFQLDLVIGKGPSAHTLRLDLPRFSLIGATTRAGLITGPLRSRFELVERLDHYPVEDLEAIVRRSAGILDVALDDAGAREIARRSRGTPRIANRLLRRVRDFAQVRGDGRIDGDTARRALAVFQVDEMGLDKVDASILDAIIRRFGGGPVGLSTLAVAVGEEPDTVEDVYEPYLMQIGFIRRTPRGRVATEAAFRHVGAALPTGSRAATLFEA